MTFKTPPDLLGAAAAAVGDHAAAARILPLVDLTALGEGDTGAVVNDAEGDDAGAA